MIRALSIILTAAACVLAIPMLILIGLSDLLDALSRTGAFEQEKAHIERGFPDGETKGGEA